MKIFKVHFIFEETDFKEYVERTFKVGTVEMVAPDEPTSIHDLKESYIEDDEG